MMIDSLHLQRFRSYRDAAFEFEPGVNIIVGPNASGKTNLLEAVLLGAIGSSFRSRDPGLIAFGAEWSRLDMYSADENRTVKLMKQQNGSIKKEYEIAGAKLSRLSLQRTIPAVLFEPNHLLLIRGSPESRREYFDDLIEQLVPGYGKTRRDFKRILAQRNALLKRGQAARDQLFAWNVRMCEAGEILAKERADILNQINSRLGGLYDRLAGSGANEVTIKYEPVCDVKNYSTRLLKILEDSTEIDLERGFTTRGPHRDDMVVEFNGRPALDVASRGETRTLMLALKIIELEFIEAKREQKPLLLLDDVFSELDGKRRKALTEVLKNYQTFITTTDADIILHHFTEACHIIPLEVRS